MTNKTFEIDELYGIAWQNAIIQVGALMRKDKKKALEDWRHIQNICLSYHFKFDENGNGANSHDTEQRS